MVVIDVVDIDGNFSWKIEMFGKVDFDMWYGVY